VQSSHDFHRDLSARARAFPPRLTVESSRGLRSYRFSGRGDGLLQTSAGRSSIVERAPDSPASSAADPPTQDTRALVPRTLELRTTD
jgi:hypothetical protein